jgi:hypothetical protein
MTDKRDFDRAVDRWLDDGTDATPPEVIDAVLLAARNTPQERGLRIPWRTSSMQRLAYTMVAVAAIAVGVAAIAALSPDNGIGAHPTPTATPPPTVSPPPTAPAEARFTSAIHGVSIDIPSGWQARPATQPWTDGALWFDAASADVLFDPTLDGRVYLVLASQPLGSLTAADWRSDALSWLCSGGGEMWALTVDGVNGQAYVCTGSSFAALIPKDGRGYVIRLVVPSQDAGLVATYDVDDWLLPLLQTVDLRPEEAVDYELR